METIFSITALALSIISIMISLYWSVKDRRDSSLLANHSNLIQIESLVGDFPSILRFHGIDEKELKKHGLTSEEFAYLLNNFTAGGTFHRMIGNRKSTFKKGTYRYNMCVAEPTRKAFPLIKQMLEPSRYRDKIENTIKKYERGLAANAQID